MGLFCWAQILHSNAGDGTTSALDIHSPDEAIHIFLFWDEILILGDLSIIVLHIQTVPPKVYQNA